MPQDPTTRSTERLLAKLDLEWRELTTPTQGSPNTPNQGNQALISYAIYHRGTWDASPAPTLPNGSPNPFYNPDKAPKPIFTANTKAEIRQYLINLVDITISQDKQKPIPREQVLSMARAASANARQVTAEAKRQRRREGHNRRQEAKRTGKPAIVHYSPKS